MAGEVRPPVFHYQTIRAHDEPVTAAVVGTRSGQLVATGSAGGSVRLWRVGRTDPLAKFRYTEGAVASVALDDAECELALGTDSGQVRVADLAHMRVLSLEGGVHSAPVRAISYCGAGSPVLASVDSRGGLLVWDARARRLAHRVPGFGLHEGPRSVAWTADGSSVVQGGADGLRCVDVASGGEVIWATREGTRGKGGVWGEEIVAPVADGLAAWRMRDGRETGRYRGGAGVAEGWESVGAWVGEGGGVVELGRGGVREWTASGECVGECLAEWGTVSDVWVSEGARGRASAGKRALLVVEPRGAEVVLWGVDLSSLARRTPSGAGAGMKVLDVRRSPVRAEVRAEELKREPVVVRHDAKGASEVRSPGAKAERAVADARDSKPSSRPAVDVVNQPPSRHSPSQTERSASPISPPRAEERGGERGGEDRFGKPAPRLVRPRGRASPGGADGGRGGRGGAGGGGGGAGAGVVGVVDAPAWAFHNAGLFVSSSLVPSTRHAAVGLSARDFVPPVATADTLTSRRTPRLSAREGGRGLAGQSVETSFFDIVQPKSNSGRLRARLERLRLIARLWHAGDVEDAMAEAEKSASDDPTTLADVLATLAPASDGVKRDVILVPSAIRLLQRAPHEHHSIVALRTLQAAAEHLASLTGPHGVEALLPAEDRVNVAAQERYERALHLEHLLKSAAAVVASIQAPATQPIHVALEECRRAIYRAIRSP